MEGMGNRSIRMGEACRAVIIPHCSHCGVHVTRTQAFLADSQGLFEQVNGCLVSTLLLVNLGKVKHDGSRGCWGRLGLFAGNQGIFKLRFCFLETSFFQVAQSILRVREEGERMGRGRDRGQSIAVRF